jgi:hypothetical protein
MKKFNETMSEFNKIMGKFEAGMSEFEKSMKEFESVMGELKEIFGDEPEPPQDKKINMEDLLVFPDTPWDLSSWEGITPEEEADLKYQQWKHNWLGCRDKNPSAFKPEE